MLADLRQDIRYTLRSIRFAPGFWAVTVLILALGIGATTTIFSVVDGVLLKRLPYPEPERIAYFQNPSYPAPRFVDYQEHSTSFETLSAVFTKDIDYTGGAQPIELRGGLMTPGFLELFGTRVLRGRLFTAEDFQGPPTCGILGWGAWQHLFGGDPDVVGRVLTIDDQPTEVIGVLDRGFTSPDGFQGKEIDLWLAMDPRWERWFSPNIWMLDIYGRVMPSLTVAGAQTELNERIKVLAQENPDLHTRRDEPALVELAPLQTALVGETRQLLLLLLGAVGMLLLIATANVANIFLARGTERIHEVAVRSALGARRGRILSQLLTESALLGLIGGLLGVVLAFAGVWAFEVLNPGDIPLIQRIAVDGPVLAFAVGVSLLTGLLFGLVPARRAGRLDVSGMLRDGVRSGEDRDRGRLRNALVVAEIALALVLLTGAGLLINSFVRLQLVDPGFDPAGLVGIELSLEGERYPEETRAAFVQRVDERLENLPGVVGAAAAITIPFQYFGQGRSGWFQSSWETAEGEKRRISTMLHPATSDYFDLLGVDLRGRTFEPGDETAEPVPIVVSDSYAEQLYPGQDALGRLVRGATDEVREMRIVGIVSGLHAWGLDQGSQETIYLPWERNGSDIPMTCLLVRTERDPGAMIPTLREAVWALDPDMPLPNIFLLEQRVSESLTVPKFYSALLGTFAVVAILLAAGGIYGSMLYSVGRRRREMGIRTALGADRARLLRMVLGRSGRLTLLGVVLGAAGAFGLTRFLESMLFEVPTTDPLTFGAVALLMVATALGAALWPAWQAATADPVEALRRE